MKEKLKNLMKNKVFIGCVSGVLVLAIILTTVLLLPDKKTEQPATPETSGTSETQSVPDIEAPDTTSEPVSAETESMPADISADAGDISTGGDVETGGKADTPANPVEVKEPEKPVNMDNGNDNTGDSGGITIGNPPVEEKYSCRSANHHCQDADYHAALLNRELEGCPYCNSHSCPSFYAINEWGFTTLDITLCPKYNQKNDPLHYCQDCGKKPGDGSNGTCVQFIMACNCPNCGEWVESNTCHTCK